MQKSSKKIYSIFIILSLTFGIIFSILIPLYQVPDEETHLNLLYSYLGNDIDFSEFTFKKTYSSGDSYIVIEGNGYSWYNIDYEVTADRDIVFLDPNTAPTNNARSKIQNLSIVGSVFSIIPNNYDDKNHEGLGVDFEIIDKNILLENVIIDAIVYCGEAEANVRSNSPSYVDKIYPSTTYDKENDVNINIRVME